MNALVSEPAVSSVDDFLAGFFSRGLGDNRLAKSEFQRFSPTTNIVGARTASIIIPAYKDGNMIDLKVDINAKYCNCFI